MYVTNEFVINLICDPDNRTIPEIQAYQRDGLTRKIELTLKEDDNDWNIPANAVCLIRFVKPDGHGGVYTTLPDSSNAWVVEGNKITITLVPQMFDVAGYVEGEAVLIWGDESLAITDFHVFVTRNPRSTEEQTSDYYSFQNLDEINTALTKLFTKVQTDTSLSAVGQPADAAATGARMSQLSTEKSPGIESAEHPGCYYRMVNGEKEWLNPPMVLGVEYRTTKRNNGKPVCVKMIDCGIVAIGSTNVDIGNLSAKINPISTDGSVLVEIRNEVLRYKTLPLSWIDGNTVGRIWLQTDSWSITINTENVISLDDATRVYAVLWYVYK